MVLYSLYRSEQLDIGRKSLEKHDFVERKGCLIIKTERLNMIIHETLKGIKFGPRAISKQFDDNGLLETDNSARHKSTKKFKEERALYINLDRLKEYFTENKDNLPEELRRSMSPSDKALRELSDFCLRWSDL